MEKYLIKRKIDTEICENNKIKSNLWHTEYRIASQTILICQPWQTQDIVL